MAPRNRAAFTLVELLVVITIIGMLVALLLPAVMAARNRARITQCAHNQGQLGKAMLGYSLAKRHFPGYANTLRDRQNNISYRISWAPLLLPYIERNDLWEGPAGWRSGDKSAVATISTFICPADVAPDAGLSYVVNVGQTLASGTGVFRDLTVSASSWVTSTSLKSAARRPMIAEKSAELYTRKWCDTGDSLVTPLRFGFIWPSNAVLAANWPGVPGIEMIVNPNAPANDGFLVPIHSGVINVTFCDGHTETLNDSAETVYSLYDCEDPS